MPHDAEESFQRPLSLTLLTGLYFFFFLLSASTFGNIFPLMGHIYQDSAAKLIVFTDCLFCLYLFMGIMKRQLLTWYFLLSYNFFEIVNTIINLTFIPELELEKAIGKQVDPEALRNNNIALALGILLLTQFIYRQKHYFTNRRLYLF